jgi:uncharacterized protein YecT (DUF1311 family)
MIIFAAPSGLLQAQKTKDPCADAQTTAEMRDCAGKEYKQADDELNRVYRHVLEQRSRQPSHRRVGPRAAGAQEVHTQLQSLHENSI